MRDFMKKFLIAALLVVVAGQSYAPMTWKSGLQLADGSTRDRVDITADDISINGLGFRSVSLTADLTVSGVNGLDTGTQANGTWYALHIITNNRGSQIASLFSLSATAPAFPATYTQFRRVSWHRNNGSGDLYRFINAPDSNWFWWNENVSGADHRVLTLSSGSAIVYTDVPCAAVAAPTCRAVRIAGWTGGGTATRREISVRSNDLVNRTTTTVDVMVRVDSATLAGGTVIVGVDSSQIFEYLTGVAGAVHLELLAYEDLR